MESAHFKQDQTTMNPTAFVTAWLLPMLIFGAEPKQLTPTKLDRLAWLAGTWTAKSSNGTTTEEHWIAPKGGLMLGVNRGVRPGRRTSFEFLRIEQTKDGIVYHASPGGRKSTPFTLTELNDHTVVFSNPMHDFPQKITYRLEAKKLRVRIEGKINGRSRVMAWKWQKSEK